MIPVRKHQIIFLTDDHFDKGIKLSTTHEDQVCCSSFSKKNQQRQTVNTRLSETARKMIHEKKNNAIVSQEIVH